MNRKKLILIIIAAVLVLSVGGSILSGVIAQKRETGNTLSEGVRLAAYEIRMYLETGDEDYFHRASADMQSLEQLAQSDSLILSDEYRKEAFMSIISAFRYKEEELLGHAERLESALRLISENTDEDYPYAQLNIILNDIT